MNNKIIISLIVLLLLGLLFFYNRNTDVVSEVPIEKSEQVTNTTMETDIQVGTYDLLSEESEILWTAHKPLIVGYTHRGTMSVKEGSLSVADDKLSLDVVIDMTKIKVLSLGGGKAGNESKLEGHLKTGDFFNVEEFPEGTFSVKDATKNDADNTYTITGDLTLKNITHEISFPATISQGDGKVTLEASPVIDRTKWDITFGSASFFDSLAENAISDEVELSLKLVAETTK